jgi:hypothetical protein
VCSGAGKDEEHCESLWDNSGTQKGKRPSLEAGNRGLVRDSRSRGLSACSGLHSVKNRVRLRTVIKNWR